MYGTDKFKRKRRWGEKTKSFKGYQLIGELVENMQCTVGEAVDRCQKMMDLGFIKAMKSKYANEPFSNDKRVSYYFVVRTSRGDVRCTSASRSNAARGTGGWCG